MDPTHLDPSLPPEDSDNKSLDTVKFGPYEGKLSSTDEGNYFLIDFSGLAGEVNGTVEFPLDGLNRLKMNEVVSRCSYIDDGEKGKALEIGAGKFSSFEIDSIMEIGTIDNNELVLNSIKIYPKASGINVVPILTEGILESPELNEYIYYKFRQIGEITYRDSGPFESFWRSTVGCMYWFERYRKAGRNFKSIGGHSTILASSSQIAIMRKPTDIVVSRIFDDPTVVNKEVRKFYAPKAEEREKNRERFKKLLEYRDKYFPS